MEVGYMLQIAPSFDLTGTWQGDDGSVTYLRQVQLDTGTQIFWSSTGIFSDVFSNVFTGYLVGSAIMGQWVDVPQTGNSNIGTLFLQVITPDRIIQVDASRFYETRIWTRIRSGFPSEVSALIRESSLSNSEGRQAPGIEQVEDLTGIWQGNDGSVTYLRQVSLDTGIQIFWSSVGVFSPVFSNIFTGYRVDSGIMGQWVDVPQTFQNQIGTLQLEVINTGTIRQVANTAAYATMLWTRVRSGFPPAAVKPGNL
jgi:hypothetical protein